MTPTLGHSPRAVGEGRWSRNPLLGGRPADACVAYATVPPVRRQWHRALMSQSGAGLVPMVNGRDLTGWFATPRSYGQLWPGGPTVADVAPGLLPDDYEKQAAQHPAVWTVEDSAIVGRQDPPGSGWGGYLVSDATYVDVELIVEANPDWPADTGIYLRKRPDLPRDPSPGRPPPVRVHRRVLRQRHRRVPRRAPFAIDARDDTAGNAVGLGPDDPVTTLERFRDAKRDRLSYAASLEEFLDVWRWRNWNEQRVRIVGAKPVVTTWLNGGKIAELDMATLVAPNYDADAVAAILGPRGQTLTGHDRPRAPGCAAAPLRGERVRERRPTGARRGGDRPAGRTVLGARSVTPTRGPAARRLLLATSRIRKCGVPVDNTRGSGPPVVAISAERDPETVGGHQNVPCGGHRASDRSVMQMATGGRRGAYPLGATCPRRAFAVARFRTRRGPPTVGWA